MNIKNTVLSAIIGLATFTCMAATESQTQPEVGKPAPDFSLTTGDGSQVSLKDYRGKWVVHFYPKDFTSGCTLEAHNFQRDIAKYGDAGAVILGASVDTAQSHKDFCAKEGLNFKLLADPDAKVSTEYGSMMDYKGQKLAARNTFIVNPDGEVVKVYTSVKPAEHSEQVLKDLGLKEELKEIGVTNGSTEKIHRLQGLSERKQLLAEDFRHGRGSARRGGAACRFCSRAREHAGVARADSLDA